MFLIVDDHADTSDFLCRLLSKHGHPTHCASDGVEALNYLQSNTPRLIVLDLNMPRMNGFEVLTAMKQDERLRSIPVLMYSASREADYAQLAMMLGAKAYMVKGVIGFAELLALVQQHAAPAGDAG